MNDDFDPIKDDELDSDVQKRRKILLIGLVIIGSIGLLTIGFWIFNSKVKKGNDNAQVSKMSDCVYTGKLVNGAKYTDGTYEYYYMMENTEYGLKSIEQDGWGVKLIQESGNVSEKLCSSINDKPIVSTSFAYADKRDITTINLEGFDTSKVVNMEGMFRNTRFEKYDLSSFDTSNVLSMAKMFENVETREINVSNFNLSKTEDISLMFHGAKIDSLDLTNWNMKELPKDIYNFLAEISSEQCYVSTKGDMYELKNNSEIEAPADLNIIATSDSTSDLEGTFASKPKDSLNGEYVLDVSNVTYYTKVTYKLNDNFTIRLDGSTDSEVDGPNVYSLYINNKFIKQDTYKDNISFYVLDNYIIFSNNDYTDIRSTIIYVVNKTGTIEKEIYELDTVNGMVPSSDYRVDHSGIVVTGSRLSYGNSIVYNNTDDDILLCSPSTYGDMIDDNTIIEARYTYTYSNGKFNWQADIDNQVTVRQAREDINGYCYQ